jgi:hypothetical protein
MGSIITLPPGARLDDVLESRVVPDSSTPGGGPPDVQAWICDFACKRCEQYGGFKVTVTGGPRSERTGKLEPSIDDEEFRRRLWVAHQQKAPGCLAPLETILVGRLWRWDRVQATPRNPKGREMVLLLRRGETESSVKRYYWPPNEAPWRR